MNLNQIILKNEHRLLALMLFCLLAATWPGNNPQISQVFMIAHFGFFLLWQPVIKQQQNFSIAQTIALICLIFAFIYWFNPWLNAFWYLLLLSLLSGRIFARGMNRVAYGIAVITLFLQLVLVTIPGLFHLSALSSLFQQPFSIFIRLFPLVLLVLPAREPAPQTVDFVRGFLFVLLLIFLLMGSALISLVTRQPYLQSLIISIMLLGAFLLLAGFLWSPRGGFSGFAKLWEKYLLNLGGPFEEWILHVDSLAANTSLSPDKFLSATSRYLLQQHWVAGMTTKTGNERVTEGRQTANQVAINNEQLELTLYTYTPVGPVLLLHAKLLLNVLAFYYRAKLQEQMLIRQAHMRAIYETGSKLTHDVKNILQSTQTMTQIINDNDASKEEILGILKKQMPILTQRLNTTLEKLRIPASNDLEPEPVTDSLFNWWNQLQQRYTGRHINFSADIQQDREIPIDVFTTVIENLLDNARSKRSREPGLEIFIALSDADGRLQLSVVDTGSPVEADIARRLFQEVVSSHDGFGIGLYQCHELARKFGYRLTLAENEPGKVRFLLKQI
ncbi:MAG TPA: HAMP domain-containing histidine kinase [Gammaproteobacteria bacterium]|nr:HAMP domain-containing histidine kinase [Gammaproteobacteria bacterium]